MEFSADTLRLNLVELARIGSKLVAVAGHVDFICQEVDAGDPLTFTTPSSHLVRIFYGLIPNFNSTVISRVKKYLYAFFYIFLDFLNASSFKLIKKMFSKPIKSQFSNQL